MSSTITALTSGGGLAMAGDTSGQLELKTNNGTTAVTVDTSQNVGIGTASPTSKLTLKTADGDGISIQNASGTAYRWAVNADNSFACINTGVAERMRIDSSGNLLVGDPTVTGTRLFVKSAGTSSATNVILGRNSADVNQFSVRSDGAGFLNSGAWVYGSDATTKENIEYIEPSNCLSLLLNAKPVKFDYIDGQKHNFGYIAQDVQEWLPEAISETPNGKLGLQDGFINALGTGAIQELAKQIQELNAKVDAQALEIQALKATPLPAENE